MMNRKSIGDIYSPLRNDVSLNESESASGSVSESFGASFCPGFIKDELKSLETIKDEDLCEQQTEKVQAFSQVNSRKRNSRSKRPNNLPLQKGHNTISPRNADDLFGTSPITNALLGPEPPRQEHITRKKSPGTTSLKKQTDQKQDKPASSKKETKENLDKSAKSKKLSNENQEKLASKKNSTSKNVSSQFITARKDLTTEAVSWDLLNFGDSIEKNVGITEANFKTGVDCSTQTDLTMTDLQILMKKADLKTPSENKRVGAIKTSSGDGVTDLVSLPNQLQTNALEKLKDTMDEEFRVLRQLLYAQQLSLGKVLYQNLDGTNEVIEGLNNMFGLLKDQLQMNAALSHPFNL